MTTSAARRWAAPAVAVAAVATLTCTTSAAVAAPPGGAGAAATARGAGQPHLALGPADLPESRTSRTLQPGVTLTEITRGTADPALSWTVEAMVEASPNDPDPDAPPQALADEAAAQRQADRLAAEGYPARVEAVAQPRSVDIAGGTLGYRVRVGSYPTKAAADDVRGRLAAAGHPASSVFTGWDGQAGARGPWRLEVVTIDPRRFHGRLDASYGPDLRDRETTSALSRAAGATVGVNGGFFVLDPASGAPGDPAGVGVYDGRLLSEPTAGRPALVLRSDARGTSVPRLSWKGEVVHGGGTTALDGINRVPGLIRNCGGDPTDLPTALPLHDTTCTDDSELVAFTPQYGAQTPAGPGREVVLDAHSVVRSSAPTRGTALSAGQTSIQGTGALAQELARLHVGDRVGVRTRLVDDHGRTVRPGPDTSVVNGGPQLVRDGRWDVTLRQDGMVQTDNPGFLYGWAVKRNPRTFAGVDAQGRTVLVTADGRSTADLGLSIPETADVARSLGLTNAINLDGGGSTAMAVGGRLVTHPSDPTGERAVGDALLVLPAQR